MRGQFTAKFNVVRNYNYMSSSVISSAKVFFFMKCTSLSDIHPTHCIQLSDVNHLKLGNIRCKKCDAS